jgi:hypothetical protein
VIVRRDAPPGVQLAQTIHAAGWSAQLPDAGPAAPPATAIALAASADELATLARTLAEASVRHVLVHEPDAPTRFATLDDQRAWLREHENRYCATAAEFARMPSYATLVLLREGKLPL